MEAMTERDRFLACMEYKPVDRVPNHEVGVWEQTKDRWETEGMVREDYNWDWFTGSDQFGMDAREFIPVHYGMWPYFEEETLEETLHLYVTIYQLEITLVDIQQPLIIHS